mgnify:CR=1 FL=1
MARSDPRIVVASPGAGTVRRGYEAFAIDFATQLSAAPGLVVRLLQGGGSRGCANAVRIPRLQRYGAPARWLAGRTRLYPSTVEHFSFGVLSVPFLQYFRPSVIVTAERPLANFYGWLRRRMPGLEYTVLLRNGGHQRPPFRWVDHVLHHTPAFRDEAAAQGDDAAMHSWIPYGFDLSPPESGNPSAATRASLRATLRLPPDRPILLSVGLIDDQVKRMDHIVRELADLPKPLRPFLVILGQHCERTPCVREIAKQLLGADGFRIDSVEPAMVRQFYAAADAFVLASLGCAAAGAPD